MNIAGLLPAVPAAAVVMRSQLLLQLFSCRPSSLSHSLRRIFLLRLWPWPRLWLRKRLLFAGNVRPSLSRGKREGRERLVAGPRPQICIQKPDVYPCATSCGTCSGYEKVRSGGEKFAETSNNCGYAIWLSSFCSASRENTLQYVKRFILKNASKMICKSRTLSFLCLITRLLNGCGLLRGLVSLLPSPIAGPG
jgi:hypothetical protein